jgi:hypothetical protein
MTDSWSWDIAQFWSLRASGFLALRLALDFLLLFFFFVRRFRILFKGDLI